MMVSSHSKSHYDYSKKVKHVALVLFVLLSGASASGQILYYYDEFAGGVTAGGYAPHYAGSGTGKIQLHFPVGATVRKAFLFAGDHHSNVPITVELNGMSFTFNDANKATQGFYSFYGSPAYVHAIDVRSAINPALATQALVVPDQASSQRFTDFYLLVSYNIPGHKISRVSMFLDTTGFDSSMIYVLPVFAHAKGTADLGMGLYTGYICDAGDAEDVYCNQQILGNIYGPESNSGSCAGPYANFYYDNGTLQGLGDDNADLQMNHADVLSNIRTLVNPQDSFLTLHFEHTVTHNSDNSIWGVILIDGDTGCAEISMLSAKPPSMNFRTGTICSGIDSITEILTNTGCDPLIISSAVLQSDPDFSSRGLATGTIAPHDTLRFVIYLSPLTKGLKKGIVRITSYSVSDPGAPRQDSILLSGSIGDGSGVLASFPGGMTFKRMTLCTGADSMTGYITNTGCDTVLVDKVSISSSEFSFAGFNRKVIAPLDTERFIIFLTPKSKGAKSGNFIIDWHSIGNSSPAQTNTVSLGGYAGEDSTDLFSYPSVIKFHGLTMCSPMDSLVGFITNAGCDTLITTVAFLLDPDYSVSGLNNRVLFPSDTERFTVYITPHARGSQKGSLTIIAHHGDDTVVEQIHVITIDCTVADGIRTLEQKPDSIDFGITQFCVALDTIISLKNTGCDTLRLDSASLSGSGFSFGNFMLPILLGPGESIRIPLTTTLDTAGGKPFSSSTFTVNSNADNSVVPLVIRHRYQYKQDYSLFFDPPNRTGSAGDTVEFILRTDADLAGVQTIDFDLVKRSEILSYTSSSQENLITFAGGHIHISGSPLLVLREGVIDTLRFAVYLAKDSIDDLEISNIQINSGDSTLSPCSSITSVTKATFRYHYLCGDRMVQNSMNGIMPLRFVSVRPNPASDMMNLELYSASAGEVLVNISNTLGMYCFCRNFSVRSGEQNIALDISTLSSGVYTIELSGSGSKLVSHFIKLQ